MVIKHRPELNSLRAQPVESLKVVRLESLNNGMMEYRDAT